MRIRRWCQRQIEAVRIRAARTIITFLICNIAMSGYAQSRARLSGIVSDEAGGRLASITVTIAGDQGRILTSTTDDKGSYLFTDVLSGKYQLTIEAPGFRTFTSEVNIGSAPVVMNAVLNVSIAEQMDVNIDSRKSSTDPDSSTSIISLTKKQLDVLPNDRNLMLQTLQEMAGTLDGGGAVYVDGFENPGRIPPRSLIQEVRINTSPFSAEYSEPGRGRIEIFTKPGSDGYHGDFAFDFNDARLNARNAFAAKKAPLQIRDVEGEVDGPIVPNRWGFVLHLERQDRNENSNINATILDPETSMPGRFAEVVQTPFLGTELDTRTTYLVGKANTIGIKYERSTEESINQGLEEGYDLPERAYNTNVLDHMLRVSLTSIVSERAINQLRIGLERNRSETGAVSSRPAIIVLNSFNSGGNQQSLYSDAIRRRLELNDVFSYTLKNHSLKAGGRVNVLGLSNLNRANFGGTFTFGSGSRLDSRGNPVIFSALEMYKGWLKGQSGYYPQEYSVAQGDPFTGFNQWQVSWFIQDDWKLSDRLTISGGFRNEFQTHIPDRINLAPRFGIAWSPDKERRSVIRFGAGIFYNRIDAGITGDTIRYDGQHQRQYLISSPHFYAPPSSFDGEYLKDQARRTLSPGLKTPYTVLSTLAYERQLPGKIQMSTGFTWQRGIHLLRTRNINAPLPGSSELPVPGLGAVLDFESTGFSSRKELSFQLQSDPNKKLALLANYILSSTHSDTDGAYSSPSSPFDLSTEWGRSNSDVRHRFSLSSTLSLPFGMRFSQVLNLMSGRPFNITTGQDYNRDSSFFDRPAFAGADLPGAIMTRYGVFNPNPGPGDRIIPRNYGNSPGQIRLDMRLQKSFGFGGAGSDEDDGGEPGEKKAEACRFNATIVLEGNNILNHTNLQGFNGVLSSESFGSANRALSSRRINLGLRFEF